MGLEDVMDAKQVAARLCITVSAVHRLNARGTLPSVWLSGKRVWIRETIERYERDDAAQKRRRGVRRILEDGAE